MAWSNNVPFTLGYVGNAGKNHTFLQLEHEVVHSDEVR
jgi:hypothetical protein